MWMLRVHYTGGKQNEISRNKEITGIGSQNLAYIEKDSITKFGFLGHFTRNPFYEYWVAPSQIIGFEIIEYEGDK